MSLSIQPPTDVLVPGETTRIPIVLKLNKALKARGLHATFHAAEETKAVYTSYNAATKSTQVHTAIEHVDIAKQEFLLSGRERQGFFANLGDGLATVLGGGNHDVLEPGEYPFEVDIQIPENARPSMAGEKCRVFYELSVLVDVPAGRDVRALQSFQVAGAQPVDVGEGGPVRTRYPEDEGRGLMDSLFGPDVKVEVALAESNLRTGDTVEGIFKVESAKPLDYRAITARLISVEKTTASSHNDTHTHSGAPHIVTEAGVIDGSYTQKFSLPVEPPGPLTTHGQLFTVECFLQIEMDVPWAKDPAIRVPITYVGA